MVRTVISELHPTRLVQRIRSVPFWMLAVGGCIAGVAAAGVGLGLTSYTTHARQFCLSCHQYQRIAFEQQSKLHPSSVVCADCHREGHTLLPTRFAAEASVVRVQCQHCHEPVVSDAQREYKYNPMHINITHASHLKLPGVTCITCHYNVAHDRRERPTNRPPMEACFKCHKGQQRACDTCHPKGSLSLPPRRSRIEPETCESCHLEWDTQSYLVGGAGFAHEAHLSADVRCERCHSFGESHWQVSLPQRGCWEECHRKRPASHSEELASATRDRVPGRRPGLRPMPSDRVLLSLSWPRHASSQGLARVARRRREA